jgi:hypothetical protein
MLRKLRAREVSISRRRDRADLNTLSGDEAINDILHYIPNTVVGKSLA